MPETTVFVETVAPEHHEEANVEHQPAPAVDGEVNISYEEDAPQTAPEMAPETAPIEEPKED